MKKDLFFLLALIFISLAPWNHETQSSIKTKMTQNICGSLDGTELDHINFNNGQVEKILFYKKPIDKESDPRFHSVEMSIIPTPTTPYIKQIIFVANDKIKNKAKFGRESWYEIKIIYSTNEEEYLLLPVATKIYARNKTLNRLETIEIPRLMNKGLLITHTEPLKLIQSQKNSTSTSAA